MVTVAEAVNIIKNNIAEPQPEVIDLMESSGRVLANEIISPHEYPSCDNSLMDGFAVNWNDVQTVSKSNPVCLKIIGESRAGVPFNGKLKNGEAVQIFTGAMLPVGADTIIPIEDCLLSENFVSILKGNNINQFVRFKGAEISKNEIIAQQGTVLTAPLIGLIASAGIEKISTYQQPKAAVIVTGSELVAFNKLAEKFQVRDSNRIMLTAAVQNCGGHVTISDRIKDDPEYIFQAIKKSEQENHLILISGGSSAGAFDFTKEAVRKSGFQILFKAVNQKPGKSFFCARKKEMLLFALPGQPQAAYLCFAHYISPVIKKLSGRKFGWKKKYGRLTKDLINDKRWTQLKSIQLNRVEKDFPEIIDLKKKAITLTENIIYSDGYIILNEDALFKKNELVEIFLFPEKEIL